MSASPPLLIENVKVIDPAFAEIGPPQNVLINNGRIAALSSNTPPPDRAIIIDGRGKYLAPGLVDMRVHLRQIGQAHLETLAETVAAAAAGGVTSLAVLADTEPAIDEPSLVEFVMQRGRELGKTRLYAYGAITKARAGSALAELGLMAEAGAVGFSDAPRAIADARLMRLALSYARGFNRLVIDHPELPSLTGAGVMNEGERATRVGLAGNPAASELIMVERDIRLAELTGGRCHLGPISSGEAVEAIRAAKRRGVNITADTAPHYFALNESAIGNYRTFAKVSPPLRLESDQRALIAGLADGTIDAIASDHAPHDADAKRLPFAEAAFGVIGLETLLPIALELYHQGALSLPLLFQRLATRPAELLGLDAGTMRVGVAADLVLIDVATPRRIDPATMAAKSKNTPFEHRPVQGAVIMTIVGGRVVYDAVAKNCFGTIG